MINRAQPTTKNNNKTHGTGRTAQSGSRDGSKRDWMGARRGWMGNFLKVGLVQPKRMTEQRTKKNDAHNKNEKKTKQETNNIRQRFPKTKTKKNPKQNQSTNEISTTMHYPQRSSKWIHRILKRTPNIPFRYPNFN